MSWELQTDKYGRLGVSKSEKYLKEGIEDGINFEPEGMNNLQENYQKILYISEWDLNLDTLKKNIGCNDKVLQ